MGARALGRRGLQLSEPSLERRSLAPSTMRFDRIPRMQARPFFRWIFPAILGVIVGFLALAWAIASESVVPVWLVSLFSPGLKTAELVMPAEHASLAWTFSWFLRIAIGVNAIFYFAIFGLLAYLLDRRRAAAP